MKMREKVLKRYLDEVCDMLDTYGGRDKVNIFQICVCEFSLHFFR